MARDRLFFLRNGEPVELAEVDCNETLLDYLRLRENAVGTKEGCNEGDCGACTVAIGRLDHHGELVYEPVNACIRFLGQLDGCDLVTVEDLANAPDLHPVQRAMVDCHGSQCGFCTPGIVMSLFTLYQSGVRPDPASVDDWLAGNLCRCTGYRPIVDAAMATIDGKPDDAVSKRRQQTREMLASAQSGQDLFLGNETRFFAAPASIGTLAKLCQAHPDATILSGGTDVGLWVTKQLRDLPKIIYTGRAAGFSDIVSNAEFVEIGAGATYADCFSAFSAIDPDIGEVLRRLGSKQVRASGTIGGNVANGSPIGDTPPLLIALGATLKLLKGENERTLPIEEFFIDYGVQDRKPGELVRSIVVPRLAENEQFRAYKISKRFDQDISAVLGAFRFRLSHGKISDAHIAFGGMAATPKRAKHTEQAVIGLAIDDEQAIAGAAETLATDYAPISDMRASATYRAFVAKNLLRKAAYEIATDTSQQTRVVGTREPAEIGA